MFFSFFQRSKQRQSRQLNRDVSVIIEQAEEIFTDHRLSQIAATVSNELQRAYKVFGETPVDLKRARLTQSLSARFKL